MEGKFYWTEVRTSGYELDKIMPKWLAMCNQYEATHDVEHRQSHIFYDPKGLGYQLIMMFCCESKEGQQAPVYIY